jgi:hypothetical protein
MREEGWCGRRHAITTVSSATRIFALTIDDYPGWSAAYGVADRVYLAEPR